MPVAFPKRTAPPPTIVRAGTTGPGTRPAPPSSSARASWAGTRVLVFVAVLAAAGLLAAVLLPAGLALHPAREQSRASDPERTYLVSEAIDRRQMQPVWTLVNMSGLDRVCAKARAYTVVRRRDDPGVVPTRFIVYCRDQGFWVVEADPEAGRYATLGPLASVEEAEALIDREGNFVWGARRPQIRVPLAASGDPGRARPRDDEPRRPP
ncbi:MAG: hypothetical protein N2038_14020 [Geminicoccaceae bacterium]|nr:hypothetical protein [Geminicoccaceae bacterium]MCS7269253.1 hypothetical protein [Geminicoccaceae bacterium]MCX7631350.1 hypothetical protein [Geminicoccaceae bacterium]MDW8125315.1 hypothetical protein [Geminicoccaceae bacterium]MDW8342442.1 hypothetical protein [Geminicoccaceae bacterium]